MFDATLDDVLMGVQTYRNPRLVNVSYKLGYIENFGTGIPRIGGAYASSEEKPVFESSEYLFREYMVVGGMPEVVDAYVNSNDFNEAIRVQGKIVSETSPSMRKEKRKSRSAPAMTPCRSSWQGNSNCSNIRSWRRGRRAANTAEASNG